MLVVHDKSIEHCSLYCQGSKFGRLDVGPFVVLYVLLGIGLLWRYENEIGDWEVIAWCGTFSVSIGLHVLVMLWGYWSVTTRCFLQYRRVSALEQAEFVCVIPAAHCGKAAVCRLECSAVQGEDDPLVKSKLGGISLSLPGYWFEFHRTKYVSVSNSETGEVEFKPLDFPLGLRIEEYLNLKGHSRDHVALAEAKYGLNEFDIPSPSLEELFVEHALSPFFLFQILCVSLWCLDEYWYYSVFTLIMLVLFEITVCKQRQQNLGILREMRRPPYPIYVYREKRWVMIPTDKLVPGDICSVVKVGNLPYRRRSETARDEADQVLVPCDILLLRGSCIVNEAMLTGESVPKMKDSVVCSVHSNPQSLKDCLKFEDPAHAHHLLLGGTKIMQHNETEASGKMDSFPAPPDKGAIGVVLRTGFYTNQGSLMRTILFSTERVTVDNAETYLFIAILLVFAVVASVYVLVEGLKNEKQNRWKLFLHCTMIITSVVPPELPMELSLAVNTSLARLHKLAIFCTEPYRIPFAGKLDMCCFDKTGTLTSDTYFVKGVALSINDEIQLTQAADLPKEPIMVLAGCHQLVRINDKVDGDPMERAALKAIRWGLTKDGRVTPRDSVYGEDGEKRPKESIRVLYHFPFSSTIKRMSTIVSVAEGRTVSSINRMVLCKGAPEVLEGLIKDLPKGYKKAYQDLMIRGGRVLTLAYKKLPNNISEAEVKRLKRTDVESDLTFAGLLVLDCPLKQGTREAISQLQSSQHKVTVITGDNALTACEVARQLEILTNGHDKILLLQEGEDGKLMWMCIDPSMESGVSLPFHAGSISKLCREEGYELVITGGAMTSLEFRLSKDDFQKSLQKLCPHVIVFARVSPRHKELILAALKAAGLTCLMCGDGTNDVGALKQAAVGVSIINSPEFEGSLKRAKARVTERYTKHEYENMSAVQRIRAEMSAMEEADRGSTIVQLGDASIASPFTSRTASIISTAHIVRQGRCTLVTTIQMFKILALNCLISAYSLSALHLYGVKQGDTQATLAGLLIAGLFMFISFAEPLEKLSETKPTTKVFSLNVGVSLFGQLVVHFISLFMVLNITAPFVEKDAEEMEPDADFKPNVINTAVFLIGLCMQCNVFGVNYRGHPFMQGLVENKLFFRVLVGTWALNLFLAMDVLPELGEYFELVPLPREDSYKEKLLAILLLNTIGSW
eukprot:CAMPEP_0203755478 /NCGR_PEP_ID=MMETSP0098-20131031/8917_1 /ASSEMBLY_ACC=CAM_ASM_000208 /TAXON_ID=96639 /ORGANISM=" , Strain NY0313808BC1" /LENGTH=1190 /DNA_ID=CAMNT_0050646951 /DNA_START=103 /DNA_END=3672 /DNA_ORIENTATION=+